MKPSVNTTPMRHQRGFVSIAAVFFVILGVFSILTQTLGMLGHKASDSVQYLEGIKALLIAESGVERSVAIVSGIVAADDTQLNAACDAAKKTNAGVSNQAIQFPSDVPHGSFQYDSSITSAPGTCAVRVTGLYNQAQRTLQTLINVASEIGTAGFGHNIAMRLENNTAVPGVAVFNLAWRRHGSTGNSTSGGQATATRCPLPSCNLEWTLESSSGEPSVGALGTAVNIGAKTGVDVIQTLSEDRNYSEVGMVMPGIAGLPTLVGNFYDSKRTANTANNTVTTGDTSSGEAKGWCAQADTLVFGVSGRGNDNVTGAYASVVFNTNGNPAQPIAMNWIAHYPNTDGSTPGVFGDVFSEIWYTYNPYVMLSGATSKSGETGTINMAASLPNALIKGTILKVYSGTGKFAGSTQVLDTVAAGSTQFKVTATPSTALANATVCGGICALFDNPSSPSSSTTFALTRATDAAQQWAGGFVCLRGVDPSKIRRIARSQAKISQWNEVTSGF